MIIYNTTWLKNRAIQKQAKKWFVQKLISPSELDAIVASNPVGFYTPSFWVSLGLVFFTLILISAASGFVSFFFGAMGEFESAIPFKFLLFLLAAGCFILAEHYKSDKHYYNAGTDNALVWMGASYLIGNINWILIDTLAFDINAWLVGTFLAFIILVLLVIRHADLFVTVCAFAAWFIFLFLLCGKFDETSKALIPFAGLLNAGVAYYLVKKYNKGNVTIYWGSCLFVVETLALIVGYFSVNYFVVRELSVAMFDLELSDGLDIPFAPLFYFFTVAIPCGYVYFGLQKKNRNLLRIGLLLVAVAVLTIRQYHSIMAPEIALTIFGAILVAVSYLVIRYLRQNKTSYTFEREVEDNDLLNAEGILIAQTFATQSPIKNDGSSTFGGGQYGGGGASGGY